ncbi:hypothetical protein L195_g058610, partial [Trifolium pratense]
RSAREAHSSSVSAALMAKAPSIEPATKTPSSVTNSQPSQFNNRGYRGKKTNCGGRNSGGPNSAPNAQQNGVLGPGPQLTAFNVNTPSPTDIENAIHTLNLASQIHRGTWTPEPLLT